MTFGLAGGVDDLQESGAMARLDLLRTEDDPQRFELGRLGTLRFASAGNIQKATATVGDDAWSLARVGVTKLSKEARNGAGEVVGTYRPGRLTKREFGRSQIVWEGRALWLRRSTKTGADFQVLEDELELFTIKTKRFHKSKVEMGSAWIEEWDRAPAALVLFALFCKFGEGKGG